MIARKKKSSGVLPRTLSGSPLRIAAVKVQDVSNTDPASLVRKRTSRLEAVIISEPKKDETYVSVVRRAIAEVNLKDLDFDVKRFHRIKAGAILFKSWNEGGGLQVG